MAKNLNLGNFSTTLMSNISKLQVFLKNNFYSNWRSYLVLTSDQKPKKKIVKAVFEKNIKVPDFGLICRPFREYLQIKNFFQKSDSITFPSLKSPNFMQKIRKVLRAISEKTALPTNQLTNQLLKHRSYRTSLTLVQKQQNKTK